MTELDISIYLCKKLVSDSFRCPLGQLVVIAFRYSNDADPTAFLNFRHCRCIDLAVLPNQYKVGAEAHNKALFQSRIKTGKKWMSYLPKQYHNELIASLFLEINEDRAARVLKTFHNNQLRLSIEDLTSLKS